MSLDAWKMEHPTMVKWFYPTWQPYTPSAPAEKAETRATGGGGRARAPTQAEQREAQAATWTEFAASFTGGAGLLELIQSYLLLSPSQQGWFLARNPELAAWLREQDPELLARLKASLGAHQALTGGAQRGRAWRRAPTLRWYRSW